MIRPPDWRILFSTGRRKQRLPHIRKRSKRWRKREKISKPKSVAAALDLTSVHRISRSQPFRRRFLSMLSWLNSQSIARSMQRRRIIKKLMVRRVMLLTFCIGKAKFNGRISAQRKRLTTWWILCARLCTIQHVATCNDSLAPLTKE